MIQALARCLFVAALLAPAAGALAASVEDFYKGKTIQFIVGGSAGGVGSDGPRGVRPPAPASRSWRRLPRPTGW